MLAFPDTFDTTTRPLTAEGLGPADAAALKQLAEKDYEIHVGLTPEYADAIIKMALEPDIREYCPKDCAERFADRAAHRALAGQKAGRVSAIKT